MILVMAGVFGFLFLRDDTAPRRDPGEGTNFISQFNPFGNSKDVAPGDTTPPVDVSGYEPSPTGETQTGKLVKVSSMPVAGFGVFMKERLKYVPVPPVIPAEGEMEGEPVAPTTPPTEFVPAVRYVDRASGNIYQSFADRIEERKFSGTIIPKVYEAYFGNGGESVGMRYLKGDERTIETFVGTLPKEHLGADSAGTNEIKGNFLPDNVKDVSIESGGSQLFYLSNSGDGVMGTTLSFLDNKKVQVFDSPFTEWLSQWPNKKMITMTTKPSAGVPGYMYAFDPSRRDWNKILGGINGLTTQTSPDGTLILYSNNTLSLSVYDTSTRNGDVLGVSTLPEKCVWGNQSDAVYCAVPKSIEAGLYPDSWYQGEVTLYDQIWKIDIENGDASLVLDPLATPGGEDVDGIKLTLDVNEDYLFFVNKKDSFLWKLELE